MPKTFTDWLKALVLIIVIALIAVAAVNRQAIMDEIKLASYDPPASIVQLADDDTMTASAKRLFYINHPALESKAEFRQDCPNNSEQTIVLGCYRGNESGIYLLRVTDQELNGVEQVTAAHEMLHAAYDRLGRSEKNQVDGWLESYYKTLKNPELKKIFDNYKKTEPGQLVNEMHSVFGTEVANLPKNLENYYKRYFTDRQKVTGYASQYRSVFLDLRQQIAGYDNELKKLKPEIEASQAQASALDSKLQSERNQMNADRASGNYRAYNAAVPGYNSDVERYNQLVQTIKSEVATYNQIVAERNKLAISINNLGDELNANVQTVSPAS